MSNTCLTNRSNSALLLLAGLFAGLTCLSSCVSSNLKESQVGNGWANNSVNTVIFRQNALTSFKEEQFTAFYDDQSYLILAKRRLPSGTWEVQQTPYKGNTKDAHNAISIAVDGDGYLHVSWDHHDTPLRYAVSKEPMGLVLGEEREMTGISEDKISYPQFYNLKDGKLLFLYRSGQSGRGSLVANTYDASTRKWVQLHNNLIDGENQRNAYWQSHIGEDGTIHLSWVWRETWDVSTNHDIGYARSRDGGITWERSSGEKYTLPITAKTAEYAWEVPQNSSLINQTSMTADENGNPFISSYWKENGITQFQVVYREDTQWKKQHTSFRTSGFDLGGGGTKKIPISRPEILVHTRPDSKLVYLLFRDEERGNKVSLASKDLWADTPWEITDLTQHSVGEWEPNFDKELFRRTGKLHIFVQNVTQVDGEGVASEPSTPVRILEVNELSHRKPTKIQ